MQRITRKAAKAAGLKHYFTGKPCKRSGHIEKRYVASFACAACCRDKANQHYAALDVATKKRLVHERRQYRLDWAKEHREHIAAHGAAYREIHKEKHAEYFREHYAKNSEKRKKQANAWYRANHERVARLVRAYAAAHPDQVRASGRRQRSKRRAIEKRVFVEVVDQHIVFERDKGMCGICRLRVDPMSKWEIDHIIPISKNGPHSYANVQLTHRMCNRSKAARLPNA